MMIGRFWQWYQAHDWAALVVGGVILALLVLTFAFAPNKPRRD